MSEVTGPGWNREDYKVDLDSKTFNEVNIYYCCRKVQKYNLPEGIVDPSYFNVQYTSCCLDCHDDKVVPVLALLEEEFYAHKEVK